MIAMLTGTIASATDEVVVVDVGGVGYLVRVPDRAALPAVGQPCTLHTHLIVREDAMDLYGFTSTTDQALFGLLLSASGVGPKTALAALRTMPAATLASAITTGDATTLTQIPGVGRKGADRIVLELAGQVQQATFPLSGQPANGTDSITQDATDALRSLGYAPAEIHRALTATNGDDRDDVATLVRGALQVLSAPR